LHSIEETDLLAFYITDDEGYISPKYAIDIWMNNSVSVKDVKSNFGISISPNPSEDVIHLQIHETQSTPLMLTLLDMNGKVVLESMVPPFQNQKAIDVSNLSPGMWILRISDREKISSSKVMIVR